MRSFRADAINLLPKQNKTTINEACTEHFHIQRSSWIKSSISNADLKMVTAVFWFPFVPHLPVSAAAYCQYDWICSLPSPRMFQRVNLDQSAQDRFLFVLSSYSPTQNMLAWTNTDTAWCTIISAKQRAMLPALICIRFVSRTLTKYDTRINVLEKRQRK